MNIVEFGKFSILHTYVPNNDRGDSHFERCRKWGEKVKLFMSRGEPRVVIYRIFWDCNDTITLLCNLT